MVRRVCQPEPLQDPEEGTGILDPPPMLITDVRGPTRPDATISPIDTEMVREAATNGRQPDILCPQPGARTDLPLSARNFGPDRAYGGRPWPRIASAPGLGLRGCDVAATRAPDGSQLTIAGHARDGGLG